MTTATEDYEGQVERYIEDSDKANPRQEPDYSRRARWVRLYAKKWGCTLAESERHVFNMLLRGEDPSWGLRNAERERWYWKGRMPLLPPEAFGQEERER